MYKPAPCHIMEERDMPGKAAKVVISERQQEILTEMATSRMCPQGLALRAKIVLAAFGGEKNEVIAERLGCERHSVGLWRRRARSIRENRA